MIRIMSDSETVKRGAQKINHPPDAIHVNSPPLSTLKLPFHVFYDHTVLPNNQSPSVGISLRVYPPEYRARGKKASQSARPPFSHISHTNYAPFRFVCVRCVVCVDVVRSFFAPFLGGILPLRLDSIQSHTVAERNARARRNRARRVR